LNSFFLENTLTIFDPKTCMRMALAFAFTQGIFL
jgi:hypothetical protein